MGRDSYSRINIDNPRWVTNYKSQHMLVLMFNDLISTDSFTWGLMANM